MKNWKRCLSVVMTLAMLVGVLPTAAFAEGETGPSIQLNVPENATYTGSNIEVGVTVTGLTGYKVSCDNGGSVSEDQKTVTVVNAGTYTVMATGTVDEVSVTKEATFSVNQKELTAPYITTEISPQTYSGEEIKPAVQVKDGDYEIPSGQYTVSYTNNTNVGTATVTVAFSNNYSDTGETVTKNFTIAKKELTNPVIADIADRHFTGSAIEPTVTVTENETEIPSGHYTVSYANNINVGTATASVTFSDNYTYTGAQVSKDFRITAAPTDKLTLEVATSSAYTGTAPAVTVKNGETTLTTGFTLSYKVKDGAALDQAPVVPGNYTVTATFDDNYAKNEGSNFTLSKDYAITQAQITDSSVSTAYDFCHASDTPEVTVTVGGRVLTSSDYDVTKSDSDTTRTITVTGKGNYTGTGTTTQTILPDTAPTIEGVASNGTYHTEPTVTVTGDNLVKVFVKQGTGSTETEYTATKAEGQTEAKATFVLDFSTSAYTIRAVDKAGKSYPLATNVTVTRKPITFSMVTITGLDDVTYDGTAKVATKIEVKDGDKTLLEGADKDYTVSYSGNTNAGTATVTITGTGNYTGTVSKTFTIKRKALTSTALSGIVDKTYTGSPIEQEGLTVKDGEKTLEKGSDKDYTVTYSNNTNPGTAKVTVVLRGNYTGTLEKTFTIGKDLSAMVNKIKALAGESDLSYDEKQQIKQLKAAYDALSATDKAYVDSGVGSTLMTSFKNKASAAKFKLLNLPGLGYYRYTKGTSSNVVIKIDADFSKTLVTEIRMGKNLTVIDPDNYEVTSGSVVVTLSSSYLKQIKDTGRYNLYIDLLDTKTGHTETLQTVVRVLPATDIPGTGDPFQMTLWVGLLAVAVAGLVGFGAYEVVKKKKNAQKRLEAAVNLDEEPSDDANTNE